MSAIDPGVEDTITQEAGNITERDQDDRDQQEEDDFMQPSQWWFASTACPLLAGTFGPMASGFNILALVHSWRQSLPDLKHTYEGEGHTIQDPAWVIGLNAVSLVAALVGNASLLLNMAHRLKFSIAQPITITGFLLAGVLLIADMAALTSQNAYGIERPELQPSHRHALTGAFYYAIFASAIYIIIGLLMAFTVYGALRGHYKKDFHLTSSQRTLMLQTMSFITYLLLGALVYSHIEGWEYLNAVYWADVTLLTIGLGDFSPQTAVGRGLLFPFAIGGILMVGLVVGSIRSLILERGKEKLGARVMEKRRSGAVHNVDSDKKIIKISLFASADYDPVGLSPAQQREEEFRIMRKVQSAAERERRWFSLSLSASFAFLLWLVGAEIFRLCEYKKRWTYLEALYFSYVSLMTIGYGDFYPSSNSGKAFFVLWSLLAVPALTILISNMGDTIIKWFSDLTNWVASLTVLPDEGGFRSTIRQSMGALNDSIRDLIKSFTGPGIFGDAPPEHERKMDHSEYENKMLDRLAERLVSHIGGEEPRKDEGSSEKMDDLDRDILFYHYVLARECRNLQKDLDSSPPKNYEWSEWEYYLKLMGNEEDPTDFPGQRQPDIMVPEPMRAPKGMNADSAAEEKRESDHAEASSSEPTVNGNVPSMDGNVDRKTSITRNMDARRKEGKGQRRKSSDQYSDYLLDWSWLSNASPLMSQMSETQWILDRLSAALERELNRQMRGYKRKPPIGLKDARRSSAKNDPAEDEARSKEQRNLGRAARSEE